MSYGGNLKNVGRRNNQKITKRKLFFHNFLKDTSGGPLKVIGRRKYRKISERRLIFAIFCKKMWEGPMKVVGRQKSRKVVGRWKSPNKVSTKIKFGCSSARGTRKDVGRRRTRKDVSRLKTRKDVDFFAIFLKIRWKVL